jgi:hypothetical protein
MHELGLARRQSRLSANSAMQPSRCASLPICQKRSRQPSTVHSPAQPGEHMSVPQGVPMTAAHAASTEFPVPPAPLAPPVPVAPEPPPVPACPAPALPPAEPPLPPAEPPLPLTEPPLPPAAVPEAPPPTADPALPLFPAKLASNEVLPPAPPNSSFAVFPPHAGVTGTATIQSAQSNPATERSPLLAGIFTWILDQRIPPKTTVHGVSAEASSSTFR